MHHPRRGDLDEQQVELLEAVGGAGQPAVAGPGLLRRLAGLAVRPLVVGAGDPPADRGVELRQREPWRAGWPAADEVAGQVGQQFGGDGAEEPFELAAPCGRATAECTSSMCRSAASWARWSLVKSLPWSAYSTSGRPCTGQPGSVLRQIACRSASDRFSADEAPRKTV